VGELAQRHGSRKKCWEARARQIAVLARSKPARDQRESHRALAGRQCQTLRGLFEIEQAEIILPSLAQHGHLFAPLWVGIELDDFLQDLALQVARIGRYPKAGSVLLRPKRRGRQVAERLARACASFSKSNAGRTGVSPWSKCQYGRLREVLLLRANDT